MSDSTMAAHPDPDVLADLAAEVLPPERARAVEAHVMSCPSCTQVLEDTEQLRGLLLADDPGPMPDDVFARLDSALRAESRARAAGEYDRPPAPDAPPVGAGPRIDLTARLAPVTGAATGPVPASGRPEPTGTPGTTGTAGPSTDSGPPLGPSVRGASAAGDVTGPAPFGSPSGRDEPLSAAGPTAGDSPTATHPALSLGQTRPGRYGIAARSSDAASRLVRARRVPQRTRKQVRQEDRDQRTGRRAPALAIAASSILVLGLGGFLATQLLDHRQTENSTGGGGVAAAGPAAAFDVLETGHTYTTANLATQARTLVGTAAQSTAGQASRGGLKSSTREQATRDSPNSPGAPSPGPRVMAGAQDSAKSGVTVGGIEGDQSLRDPARLRACLQALQVQDQPLAVDLATFEGRPAAVIVVDAPSGGYDVWVVARDCRPGADGTMKFVQVPAQ